MEAPANKMQTADTTKDAGQEYFYPEHGITVRAGSQQEADEALAKITSEATLEV